MSRADRGRIPYVDQFNPNSWCRDDITGLPIMVPDRVKQMEYIGTGLAWTGFMVHYKDADQPNPQRIPPRLKPDPVPIEYPRELKLQQMLQIPSGLKITGSTSTSISVQWNFVQGAQAYVVGWGSIWTTGETRGIIPLSYTISGLSPGSTYSVQVASTADNSSSEASEFSTSAFSDPVQITLPLS